MTYKIYEHDRAIKFFKKNKNNHDLLLRLSQKYSDICKNPFRSDFSELKSVKCPKCHRAKVGEYRIIFYVSKEKQIIEIIDIFHRSDDYKFY